MATRSAELQEIYDRGFSNWAKAKQKPVVGAYVLPQFENTAWYALVYETARRFEVNRLASGRSISDMSKDYEIAIEKAQSLLSFLRCPFEAEIENLQSALNEAPTGGPISWAKSAATDRAAQKERLDALRAEIDTDNEFRIARVDVSSFLIDVETSELAWLVDSKIAPPEIIEAVDLQKRRALELAQLRDEHFSQTQSSYKANIWRLISVVIIITWLCNALYYFSNGDFTVDLGERRISLLQRFGLSLSLPSAVGFSRSDDIRAWLLIAAIFICSLRASVWDTRAHPGRRTNT